MLKNYDNQFCSKIYSVAEIRAALQMSQGACAEYFGIPVRTWERWESGRSAPASYLLELMNMAAQFYNPTKFKEYDKNHE